MSPRSPHVTHACHHMSLMSPTHVTTFHMSPMHVTTCHMSPMHVTTCHMSPMHVTTCHMSPHVTYVTHACHHMSTMHVITCHQCMSPMSHVTHACHHMSPMHVTHVTCHPCMSPHVTVPPMHFTTISSVLNGSHELVDLLFVSNEFVECL